MHSRSTLSPRCALLVNIIKVISLRNIRKSFAFPGVYIIWGGDCALYVGSSANVCKRAQLGKSDLKGRTEAFARRTHVDIYPCESLRQALHLETELIGIYKPAYNEQGQWQSSRSIQRLKAEHAKLFNYVPSLFLPLVLSFDSSNQDSVLEVSL